MGDTSDAKDNERYWLKRHEKLGGLRAVGDRRRSEEENTVLYADKLRAVFTLVNGLGLACSLAGRPVLDAGCGIGVVSGLFHAMGAQVTGIDVSDVALEQAALRAPGGTFIRASLVDFEAGQGGFDLILCADVLYHLVDDGNWAATLVNLHRHARPGGFLAIIDQLKPAPERPAPHVRFRTAMMYEQVLSPTGATRVESACHGGTLVYQAGHAA